MRVKGSCAGLAVVEMVLLGAVIGPWEKKDFKDWTTEDAELIMRKSPWAKEMPMPAAGRPGQMVLEHGDSGGPPPSGSLGNPSNTTTGTNMSAAGNPGSAGPADPSGTHNLPTPHSPSTMSTSSGAPILHSNLTVVWASARPIRLAVLRLRSGSNTPADSELERVTRPWPDYVIAVSGLPAPIESELDPSKLKDNAFLSVKNKAPVVASRSDYRKIGNSDVYFFHFPKAALPIAASDRQVEFKMKMGKIEVKKKFELGEMHYQGELSL